MSKNHPFNKSEQKVQKDPVAEAHKQSLEQKADTQEKASVEDNKVDSVEQETKAVAPAEVVVQEKPIEELTVQVTQVKEPGQEAPKSTPQVQDTTKVPQQASDTPTIQATRRPENPNVIKRGDGAAARQASPQAQVQTKEAVSSSFSAMIASEKVKGTTWAIDVISFLERYTEAMAPRRITSGADVTKWQESLYDKLVSIIERAPATEFTRLWRIVVAFFAEYKNACFNPMYYSRGAKDWKRDPKQFQMLTSLVNLLEATAREPKTVNEVVNVNAVVGKSFSEEGRGRVISFYLK